MEITKYLGIIFGDGIFPFDMSDWCLDKLQSKLQRCQYKYLTFAGTLVIISKILQVGHVYYSSWFFPTIT